MKVCIITLHRVYNYGSVLQAYATQRIFENMGYEVQIVDYITTQRTLRRKLFGDRPKSFKHFIRLCFKPFSLILKELTFGKFVRKKLNLTSRYIDYDDLKTAPPQADIYVTGSDQTWNSSYNEGVDKGFFLEFVDSDYKYAFCASFGKEKLNGAEVNETKRYLKKYKAISLREEQGVKIVESLGINGAVSLIDPTLQIKADEWLSIASKRIVKQKYLILMLLYEEDNHATEYARKIANEKNLKLVKICWDFFKPKGIDIQMTHRSPSVFLSLFANADFIVTNSFHGLAFSINFNKQFIVIPRNEFNSRIENLLKITGLEERLCSSLDEVSICENEVIDYVSVNAILEEERRKAKFFIEENFPRGLK